MSTNSTRLLLLLASIWFFPVSCSSGLLLGGLSFATLDERFAARGDEMHLGFSVLQESFTAEGPRIQVIEPTDTARYPHQSFLLSHPSGAFDIGHAHFQYRVLQQQGLTQIVEVERNDNDTTLWSRYRASADGVAPISSRMFHPGYVFSAFPYAIAAALFIHFGARIGLRRRARLRQQKTPSV